MNKKIQEYQGNEIIVTYDPNICIHAGECVRRLPQVFDVHKKPWVNANGAPTETIIAQIKKCPSGALHFQKK